jgi:hypothetical protein
VALVLEAVFIMGASMAQVLRTLFGGAWVIGVSPVEVLMGLLYYLEK